MTSYFHLATSSPRNNNNHKHYCSWCKGYRRNHFNFIARRT